MKNISSSVEISKKRNIRHQSTLSLHRIRLHDASDIRALAKPRVRVSIPQTRKRMATL